MHTCISIIFHELLFSFELKVEVNKSEIEFGPICIGETIKRSVTVHNNGALPTDFTFLPLSETVSFLFSDTL